MDGRATVELTAEEAALAAEVTRRTAGTLWSLVCGRGGDGVLAENLWSTIKIELVYRNAWRTRDEADKALFDYIDCWYNPTPIQKELGWLSPDEYEAAWRHAQTTHPTSTTIKPAPSGHRIVPVTSYYPAPPRSVDVQSSAA